MFSFRILAVGLLSAAACAAESPAAGKWSCTNVPVTGPESSWTLLVQEDGTALSGVLTDGAVEVALSQMKLDGAAFSFRFYVNNKPYTFEGTLDGKKLEGKYSGEEASGKLRCTKPAS
jgi:hypothetical protein